jgi:vacuolar-type H+-ATPase subunit I/STV1
VGRERREKKPTAKKAAVVLAELREDIRSLNSSILVVSQKMKYLVRNEKILGRNLIVLNKKLKALEERVAARQQPQQEELSPKLLERLEGLERRINELQAETSALKEGVASQEQLQELKYVIDSINPLELVTLEQVKELIGEKPGKAKRRQ